MKKIILSSMLENINYGASHSILDTLYNVLPHSPFKDVVFALEGDDLQTILGYLNWVCPIGLMLDSFSLFLGAISSYYIYSIILRWIRAID